jgi:lipopolysaccharide biosynthesis regulator YciM
MALYENLEQLVFYACAMCGIVGVKNFATCPVCKVTWPCLKLHPRQMKSGGIGLEVVSTARGATHASSK